MGQPDGKKIYFTSQALQSFRMNPDGSSRVQVPDRDTSAFYATSCGPDAMVFALLRDNNLNLFRQSSGAGEIRQLTSERDAENPVCTRDGKFVYYVDYFDRALKRISTATGTSEIVVASGNGLALSSDDKRIAFLQYGEHKSNLLVQDIDGGNKISLSSSGVVNRPQWTPDGRALILDKATGAGTNLFYQPLDGSKPTQITHFDSEPLQISGYSLSPDGKQIAITRAKVNDSDLILFTNFR
jgi:Tol biopolymer transport system component